jgi:hypothetical protein
MHEGRTETPSTSGETGRNSEASQRRVGESEREAESDGEFGEFYRHQGFELQKPCTNRLVHAFLLIMMCWKWFHKNKNV